MSVNKKPNYYWESARPWEEQWETLKVNESKVEEQVIDDDDRQALFWRRRPDGFAVNEMEDVIYVLEFKRVTDTGEKYVSETQKLVETQHLVITQGLKDCSKTHSGQLSRCPSWRGTSRCL